MLSAAVLILCRTLSNGDPMAESNQNHTDMPNDTDTPDPLAPPSSESPSTPCSAVDCSGITDNGCDSCVAYQMANEQLRADVKRLIVERNRITELVAKWRDMPSEEMRLRAGDMTAQEIRSVKAVLNAILPNDKDLARRALDSE